MKIDYDNIKLPFKPNEQTILKGTDKIFCSECHKTVDIKSFYKTNRTDLFPSGYLPRCKSCLSMTVDDTQPLTFLPILKAIGMPYIAKEWRALLVKKDPKSPSIIGKYVSKCRLNQFKRYNWDDSQALNASDEESMLAALRNESDSETAAEAKLESLLSFADIQTLHNPGTTVFVDPMSVYGLTPDTSKYNLTQEEIDKLKLTWGEDYAEADFLSLEQNFADMQSAYIISDPVAIQNAKIICKMNLKVNKFLDIDDIESMAKVSRQLDLFLKSSNLQPVQQKDRAQTTFAISQVAFLLEHEGGFIPEYYIEKPNDKIDALILDMQDYTQSLVTSETQLPDMIQNAQEILRQDEIPEEFESYDVFKALEQEILGDLEGEEDAITD